MARNPRRLIFPDGKMEPSIDNKPGSLAVYLHGFDAAIRERRKRLATARAEAAA